MHALNQFRHELYHRALLQRRAALFELLEAVRTAPRPGTLAQLSLSPFFQRQWPSVPDALDDGTLDPAALRSVVCSAIPPPPSGERAIWACDGSVWPRPKAETSPERTYGHWTSQGIPQEGVIPCWEYQWLGVVPSPTGSWFLPLDVARREPAAGKPTALALRQLRRGLPVLPCPYPRPVVTFDSNYDGTELAEALQTGPSAQRLAIAALVRLHPKRTFFRRPGPYAGKGRRPSHGAAFKRPDPATHGVPDQQVSQPDPRHGTVTVSVWTDLHPFGKAKLALTIIRIEVDHLPQSGRHPQPLWLAGIADGEEAPVDPLAYWQWYRLRFVGEHGFRFFKQDLGWTTVRPRWPQAADRWTWLVLLVVWHLWLAKDIVADQRLPWERPLPPSQLTPGRVRRAVGAILAGLSHPQAPLQARGKSPGRAKGVCPGRRTRFKVVKRPKKALKPAA